MKHHFVYMTASGPKEAQKIARVLVGERLAACVNILGKIDSIYWWKGKIENASEVALIAKTTEKLVFKLIRKVRELHSYECPCIVSWPITQGNPCFLKWIEKETHHR